MSKTTKIIEFISLQPYSKGYFCYIQNFSYKEVLKELKKLYKGKKNEEPTWLDCVKECPDLFMENTIANCSQRTISKNKNSDPTVYYFVICYKGIDPTDPSDMITLAHECVHLCQFYLSDFLDRNVEIEAEAYFHTYCMEKIVETINKS